MASFFFLFAEAQLVEGVSAAAETRVHSSLAVLVKDQRYLRELDYCENSCCLSTLSEGRLEHEEYGETS